ncbi:MAG: hypothetical protein AAF363_08010 [Bacteroidota bacterium]
MKFSSYFILVFLTGVSLTSCQQAEELTAEQPTTQTILIDVDIDGVKSNFKSGDDIQGYVRMAHQGLETSRTSRVASFTTEVAAGETIEWVLNNTEARMTGFEFEVQEGANFFEQAGGAYPELINGSWKATISPDAPEGSVLKYNVLIEVEGTGTLWWDPLIKTSSADRR